MKTFAPRFDNSYAALPDRFYSRQQAERFPAPQVVRVNAALATDLNLDPDWLRSEQGAGFAVGDERLPGAEPIATVYAGHQFGSWNGCRSS